MDDTANNSNSINNSNSMSILNEGFMLDSANLSLSLINDQSKNDSNQIQDSEATVFDDTENREMEVEDVEQNNDDIEDDVEELEEDGEDSVPVVINEDDNDNSAKPAKKKRGRKPAGERREEDVIEVDDDEVDENDPEYPLPQFPLSRVKKIMGICMATEDEDEEPVRNDKDKSKGKGKGNVIITKEAVYMLTIATEYFVNLIGERAATVTTSNKKKTMTFEHLRQALSDTDAFAFLEGCFQPSVIRGD